MGFLRYLKECLCCGGTAVAITPLEEEFRRNTPLEEAEFKVSGNESKALADRHIRLEDLRTAIHEIEARLSERDAQCNESCNTYKQKSMVNLEEGLGLSVVVHNPVTKCNLCVTEEEYTIGAPSSTEELPEKVHIHSGNEKVETEPIFHTGHDASFCGNAAQYPVAQQEKTESGVHQGKVDLILPQKEVDLNIQQEEIDLNMQQENVDLNVPQEEIDLGAPQENVDLTMQQEKLALTAPKEKLDIFIHKKDVILYGDKIEKGCKVDTGMATVIEKGAVLHTFLPPKTDGRPTLVLDLDHTLVYPAASKPSVAAHMVELDHKNSREVVRVVERPHLSDFLSVLADKYEMVLFTAGIRQYARLVAEKIDPEHRISFILDRSHCSVLEKSDAGTAYYFKDLNYLGRDLNRTIIIDDREYSYIMNYSNGQEIPPFGGDMNDDALLRLKEYLIKCLDLPDFTARDFLSYK